MKTVGYFCGVPICVSQMAYKVEKKPNRVHRHRRGQKLAYHQRVQKKWNKRYGMAEKRTPCIYKTNLGVVLGKSFDHGEVMVMHPDLWSAIQNDPRLLKGV